MSKERYFIGTALFKGADLTLKDLEFHHLKHVMRGLPGKEVEIVNGQGQCASAVILEIDKTSALLKVKNISEEKDTSALTLAQAIPRFPRLNSIVEKGTELGLSELWLFPAKMSEKKTLSATHKKRLFAITVAALKQCRRLYLPKIIFYPSIRACPLIPENLFFGDLNEEAAPLFTEFDQKINRATIFIGPEKGFHEEELEWLKGQKVRGVKLHHNILRTDTAAISALSILSHLLLRPYPKSSDVKK